ncbi:MAG: hypothetical protein K2J99_00070 [Lachnospiraceae bacterium]|nr:hypothetical protein [Lachnospiraceae bacterium]
MKSLGLDWYEMTANEPKSEKHFEYRDETDRKTQKCKIPYSLKKDKRNMEAALRYLCAYSYYFSENRTEQLSSVLVFSGIFIFAKKRKSGKNEKTKN